MSLVVPGWPATFGPVKARRVVHGPVARAAGANVFPLASEGSGFNADFPRPLRAAREVPAGDTVSRLPSDPAVTAEASELVLSLVRRQRVLEAERAGRLFLSRGALPTPLASLQLLRLTVCSQARPSPSTPAGPSSALYSPQERRNVQWPASARSRRLEQSCPELRTRTS